MNTIRFKQTLLSLAAVSMLVNAPAAAFAANAYDTSGVVHTLAGTTASVSVSIPSSSATLTFSDSGITASGAESGYKIDGTELTINEAGVYTITGSCSEGSVKVKKGTTGVTLILQDLSLSSSAAAPLSCNKETETTVYVVGTVTLTDRENPADETSSDAETADAFDGAAIKVKSGASLVITGTGTLTADGSACKNGIKGASLADITVEGAVTLNVKAANNGIACDHNLTIRSGSVSVTAGNDGIKAEPDDDDTSSAGTISISGGSIAINAQGDGIQGSGDVTVTGGVFNIQTAGGASGAKSLGSDDSAKGIKSDSALILAGGTFNLNTADDALHANGNLSATGGTYAIATGDDALHAEYDLILGIQNDSGPEITVTSSYEGLEGARVFLNSGSGSITASDDGVNAATDASVSEIAIYLNGGDWHIDANGDGLDAGGDSRNNSGGNVYINGGTTEVFGAANGGNAALDYDGTCTYKAGTLLTVDYTGMNMTPSTGTYVFFSSGGTMGGGMMGGMTGGMNQSGGMTGGMNQPGGMNGQMPGQQSGTNPQSGMNGQMGGMNRQQSGMGGQPGMNGQQSGMSGQASMPGQTGGMTGQSSMPGQTGGMTGQSNTTTQSSGSVSISKGSAIEVRDSSGNVLYSATGTKNATCVMLCDDSLTVGETYTLYVNGSAVATAAASTGNGQGGMMGGMNQPGGMNGQMGSMNQNNTQNQAPTAPDMNQTSTASETNQSNTQDQAPTAPATNQNNTQNQAPAAPDMNNQNGGMNQAPAAPGMNNQNGGMNQAPAAPGMNGQMGGMNQAPAAPGMNGQMGGMNQDDEVQQVMFPWMWDLFRR